VSNSAPRRVALVIGGGPAGLMAAETLAERGERVIVADSMPTPARKFLLAGRGGLNLTHSEPIAAFLDSYGPARARLAPAIQALSPESLRLWSASLGEPTFVGSSGRVFPQSFKATALLRAWLRSLERLGVAWRPRHKLMALTPGGAVFATPEGETRIEAETIVLALGGASWPRLGSDGGWVEILRAAGVEVAPLRPANGGFLADWSAPFRERFAGAIYALSSALRTAIDKEGSVALRVDLKPDASIEALIARLRRAPGQSLSTYLRKAVNLSPVAIGLLRESGPVPEDPAVLAGRLKSCPVRLTGVAPIARAISSAGGIAWAGIDDDFMLRALPGIFVAGEMIDWEAPTGGYLLQGAFATGAAAGRGAAAWLERASS
jgi:predicted flavoprotein YhiN